MPKHCTSKNESVHLPTTMAIATMTSTMLSSQLFDQRQGERTKPHTPPKPSTLSTISKPPKQTPRIMLTQSMSQRQSVLPVEIIGSSLLMRMRHSRTCHRSQRYRRRWLLPTTRRGRGGRSRRKPMPLKPHRNHSEERSLILITAVLLTPVALKRNRVM